MEPLLSALNDFHWLRPLWLLALIPVLALTILLWRQGHRARQWRQLIAPELLRHLVDPGTREKRRAYLWGLFAAWVIATLALAGPTWEKRPMPVHRAENALVIVLDLSPSMLAEDLKPNRLVRARLKIADVLRERKEGFTGLIAYAEGAHVVAPLTDDTATIRSLLNVLHPNIMPAAGSRPEAAIAEAKSLFEESGISEGQILLLTDGVVEKAVDTMLDQLSDTDFRLSILGIGTPEGAPIPNERGGFVRDRSGDIVVAQLEEERLKTLAGRTGGRYERIDASSDDVEWILETPGFAKAEQRELEREFDVWYDRGHWLALLLLPLVLYCFRRGLLAVIIALPLLSVNAPPAQAQEWLAPWLTPNQRGARALEREAPEEAAEHFENPEWKGSALYRAEKYEAAAEVFAQSDSARAHYNRGNALARAGDLEGALEAYNQALKKAPDMEDARANKALVEQLRQQKQQQNQQQSQQGDEGKKNQDSEPPEDSQQSGDQQQSGQQSSDQQKQSGQQGDNQQQGEQQAQKEGQESGSQSSQGEDDGKQSGQRASSGSEGQRSSAAAGADGDDAEAGERAEAARLREGDVSDEERQAMEQWLRRVPDDPGGLLRRKFEYESRQRRMERLRGELDGEGTEERW